MIYLNIIKGVIKDMMIEPPIDELARKMDNNKYKLCCVMSKRAKELEKRMPEEIDKNDKKAISIAAEEIYENKIFSSDSKNNL